MPIPILEGLGMIAASAAFNKGMGLLDANKQNKYNQQAMAQQFEYNKKMAEINQQHNKEMYDYTNYENQVTHMQAAGLNPALMYGMGGGGGSSTSGGQGQGVSAVGGNEMQAAAASQANNLNAMGLMSQIRLNEANAKKAEAEANKTEGVDTEQTGVMTDLIKNQNLNEIQKTELTKLNQELTKSQVALTNYKSTNEMLNVEVIGNTAKNIAKNTEMIAKQIDGLTIDNEIKEKTKNDVIEKARQDVNESYARQFELRTRGKLNEEQIQNIRSEIGLRTAQVKGIYAAKEQGWWGNELTAQKIANDLKLNELHLDIESEKLMKDWIIGMLNFAGKNNSQ